MKKNNKINLTRPPGDAILRRTALSVMKSATLNSRLEGDKIQPVRNGLALKLQRVYRNHAGQPGGLLSFFNSIEVRHHRRQIGNLKTMGGNHAVKNLLKFG